MDDFTTKLTIDFWLFFLKTLLESLFFTDYNKEKEGDLL